MKEVRRPSFRPTLYLIDKDIPLYILWYMYTILNIKTKKELKKNAQRTAKEIGIPLSTAINAFLKQFVRDKEITLSASYKPSAYLREIIEESEREYIKGETKGPFKTGADMIKSLKE